MRRWGILVGIAVIAAAVLAPLALLLGGGEDAPEAPHGSPGDLSDEQRDGILLAAEQATASASEQELEREGEELFNSTELAKAGESCNTCHTNGGSSPSLGTIVHGTEGAPDDFLGPRDPPALYDLAKTAPYGWAADFPRIEDFVTNAVANHFTDDDEELRGRRVAALTAYLETIKPPQSDFDLGTLSPAALRGEEIFQGKGGCIGCHGGPQFTDNGLHDLGIPQASVPGFDDLADDPGAAPEMPGAFNTPQLRDVRDTAPYFHNGFAKSLQNLVAFYNNQAAGVAPLNLTPGERADLIEYLESL